MRVTVHSTDQFIELQGGIKCRVWEGVTDSGVEVQMIVPRIAAVKTQDLSQFDRELEEQAAPTVMQMAFPLRMIL